MIRPVPISDNSDLKINYSVNLQRMSQILTFSPLSDCDNIMPLRICLHFRPKECKANSVGALLVPWPAMGKHCALFINMATRSCRSCCSRVNNIRLATGRKYWIVTGLGHFLPQEGTLPASGCLDELIYGLINRPLLCGKYPTPISQYWIVTHLRNFPHRICLPMK